MLFIDDGDMRGPVQLAELFFQEIPALFQRACVCNYQHAVIFKFCTGRIAVSVLRDDVEFSIVPVHILRNISQLGSIHPFVCIVNHISFGGDIKK